MAKIYLAGGLFNAGERLHNLFLEKFLQELGHTIILPQREALKFLDKNSHIDLDAVAEDCRKHCEGESVVYVGNIDGADADSGTCVEYGIAITVAGAAIVYRTDFRTDTAKEVGVNAMLKLKGTMFIYHPCFFTEMGDEVKNYYRELAKKIDEAVQALE